MEDEQPKLYLMYDESLPVEPVIQRILLRSMTILCDLDAPGVTARIRRFRERRWTFVFSDRTLLLRRSNKKTDKKPMAREEAYKLSSERRDELRRLQDLAERRRQGDVTVILGDLRVSQS